MDKVTLTVFFDDPFWVGVFERVEGGKLSACKVTFGAEPGDAEILEFVRQSYAKLRFGPAVEAPPERAASNPKRLQRQAHRQTQPAGVGTKSQQALQLQRDSAKDARKERGRERKKAEQERKFALKQEKRRQKRRGR